MTVGSKRLLGCAALVLVALAASALAQHQGHEQRTTTPTSSPPTGSAAQGAARSQKVTIEELHRSGGVPLGWKFALPGGDPAKGRQVFADLERYRCHAGHGGHAGHGAAAAAPGHLMVFVADRTTGEPVPYLPVSATIRAAGKPARKVNLAPMVGGQGFHYGVNVALPDGAHTITVTIGPVAIQAMPSVKGRFAKPVTVVFERGS